jgi:hypothetical protein
MFSVGEKWMYRQPLPGYPGIKAGVNGFWIKKGVALKQNPG